jgi:hypothetical protein
MSRDNTNVDMPLQFRHPNVTTKSLNTRWEAPFFHKTSSAVLQKVLFGLKYCLSQQGR